MSAAPISFVLQLSGDQEFGRKIQSASSNLNTLGRTSDRVNETTSRIKPNMAQAGLGLSAAASGAASLYFQFDNLQKVELRVRTAEKNVDASRASLITSQASLTKLVQSGIMTGNEYEAAQLRVSAAEQQLSIAKERAGIVQGDLTQANLQFALGVVPQMIGAVSSASLGLKGLGLSFGMAGTGATAGSFGIKGFALAMKTAMLSMGPIGLILIGIGTVLTLIATNAFGVRDAINAMGKAIGDALPFLRPLLEFFGTVGTALFGETEAMQAEHSSAASQDFAAAGASLGNNVTSSIASSGGGGGGGTPTVNVKVYLDGKEIASKIKINLKLTERS